MYYHKDTTAQSWTKLNEIITFSIDAPRLTVWNFTVAFGKATIYSKSILEPKYSSNTKFCSHILPSLSKLDIVS